MAFSTEEIQAFLLEYLKEAAAGGAAEPWQVARLIVGLQRKVQADRPSAEFDGDDKRKLIHVIWDLIFARVFIPGKDEPGATSGWPYLSITEHGRKVIAANGPLPYDPDGYLAALRAGSPNLHATALRYVEESLAAFRAYCYLASVVMLGAASERIFDDVADSIIGAIADPAKQGAFKKKAGEFNFGNRLDAVVKWSQANRSMLPGEWQTPDGVKYIEAVGEFIRKRRNDAGHPQDPPAVPSHDQMYAWLMMFPHYCKQLHSLKQHLDAHPNSI